MEAAGEQENKGNTQFCQGGNVAYESFLKQHRHLLLKLCSRRQRQLQKHDATLLPLFLHGRGWLGKWAEPQMQGRQLPPASPGRTRTRMHTLSDNYLLGFTDSL